MPKLPGPSLPHDEFEKLGGDARKIYQLVRDQLAKLSNALGKLRERSRIIASMLDRVLKDLESIVGRHMSIDILDLQKLVDDLSLLLELSKDLDVGTGILDYVAKSLEHDRETLKRLTDFCRALNRELCSLTITIYAGRLTEKAFIVYLYIRYLNDIAIKTLEIMDKALEELSNQLEASLQKLEQISEQAKKKTEEKISRVPMHT